MITVAIFVWADTPKIYATLGDLIYDDVESISRLGDIKVMSRYEEPISRYIDDCEVARMHGFVLDVEDPAPEALKSYLLELRALDDKRLFFIRMTGRALLKAIEQDDLKSYSELIKSGVIDIERHSDSVIEYYLHHRHESYLVEIEDLMRFKRELKKDENQESASRQTLYKDYRQRRIDQIHKRQEEKKLVAREAIDSESERTKHELNQELEKELVSVD